MGEAKKKAIEDKRKELLKKREEKRKKHLERRKKRKRKRKKKNERKDKNRRKTITFKSILKMRNFKTLLFIAIFTLGFTGVANAQKMGHIDFEKLVAEMPETIKLKSDIEKLGKTYQDEIEGMGKKLDAKIKKYTAEQNTQTKEINDTRATEVQQDRARYEQLRQTAYQEMQKKQNDGLVPIIEKARKAIEDVAASKGIVYVLDASVGKGLLVKKGEDLYAAVKAKLGF